MNRLQIKDRPGRSHDLPPFRHWSWFAFEAIARSEDEARKVAKIRGMLAQQYDLDDLWLSPADGSFLGFNYRGGLLAFGDPNDHGVHDLRSIVRVELWINGVAVQRVERDDPAPLATFSAALPARLKSITLRLFIQEDLTGRAVTFLNWGNPSGVRPGHPMAREAIANLSHFWTTLIAGLRKVRDERPGG